MNNPIVAFLNLAWWSLDTIPNQPNPDAKYLRRGIRAGSRWPFTVAASAPPGAKHVRIGEYLPAPYFMQSAAAWLKREIPNAQVILRDSIARYESIAEFNEWWVKTVPTHVIIETGTPCWENDLKFIKAMRLSIPSLKIAVAGPTVRERAKEGHPEVDTWIIGEYEKGAVRFVQGETGILEFDPLTREELEKAPFPMFDEPVAHHYADANPKGAIWPELTVWGSRGCRFVCSFCSFPATMTNDDPLGQGGRKVRFYTADWLESFIRYRMAISAESGFPIKSVRFDGDMENAGNAHTLQICNVMRRIGLPWSMMCRADTVNRETWQTMKDSGCFGVKVGFESASDRIVNQVVKKKLDLKAAEETCRYLRSIGMEVHSTWMLGNPSETAEESQLTLDTIKRFYAENVHTSHQLSGTAVIDGTPLANSTITDPNFIRDGDGQRKAETVAAK